MYTIAFESGKLTYSNHEVDLYNSGVNQILSVAASRGHDILHFSRNDLINGGPPSAKVSVLKPKETLSTDDLEAHIKLQKTDEKIVSLSDIHVYMLRADDIKPGMKNLDLLDAAQEHSIFLEDVRDTLTTTDKYDLVRRCPDVPQPKTIKADSVNEVYEALSQLPLHEGKAVLKDRFGYGCGAQVHLIDASQEERIKGFVSDYKHVIVQEYCPEVGNGDLVVTFFDGEHLGTMRRLPSDEGWKTNASLGSVEIACELSCELEEIAKKVAASYPGCRFSSVDMLESGKVLEINAFPGGKGLLNTHGVSVGKVIMDKIEKEADRLWSK